MQAFLRGGAALLALTFLSACGAVAAPRYGAYSSRLIMPGTSPSLSISTPSGFEYRSVSDLGTTISRNQAIAIADSNVPQVVQASAPVVITSVTLGQFKVNNIAFHIPTTTAWLLLYHSSAPMLEKNGSAVQSCLPRSGACGGHYMLLAVDAHSGKLDAPFAGVVFG